MKSYAAVVLAAGYSRRMEQFKPLLTIGGDTITDRVISLFADNGISVILVTGWRQNELLKGIKHQDILVAENPDFKEGMFSSIQTGIKVLSSDYWGFFIMPVDIPLVRPFTVRRLLSAAVDNPENIIFPQYAGKRGHPVLIPSSLIPDILEWEGIEGMKSFLDFHNESFLFVNVPDRYILQDLDTPQEYSAMSEGWNKHEIPDDEESRVILEDICRTPGDTRSHCRKVAEVAQEIGQGLIRCGYTLDLDLIRAAAALHDIAKKSRDHDLAGGQLLREMGFGATGDIVAQHTDIPEKASMEAKVVFLADKLVKGDKRVTVEERYQAAREHFGETPEIASLIEKRRQRALAVKQELENILGFSVEK